MGVRIKLLLHYWWIPAEHLETLNANIVGLIEVVGEYHANE